KGLSNPLNSTIDWKPPAQILTFLFRSSRIFADDVSMANAPGSYCIRYPFPHTYMLCTKSSSRIFEGNSLNSSVLIDHSSPAAPTTVYSSASSRFRKDSYFQ